jgi:UDP-glucose 4-epimerase
MKVLVTGGAGYIGSHTVLKLLAQGHHAVVYDNFSRGHRKAVPEGCTVYTGCVSDAAKLQDIMERENIEAVMHFAAHSQVGESVENPALYYENNVGGTLRLLGATLAAGVKYFIFSSSAAVYGEPLQTPIDEDHPMNPTNPYGETKMMVERVLASYNRAYGLRYVSLRYFNAAGANENGCIGEDHAPETHLIPLVLHTALGKRDRITVFGSDYPTSDGTAVRDYIYVGDLAEAHLYAMEYLAGGGASAPFNLGNGNGYSVMEVIEAAEKVVGKEIPRAIGPRREGDPAVLVASADKACRELGWQPRYSDLKTIISTAWKWHRDHPEGFGGEEQ